MGEFKSWFYKESKKKVAVVHHDVDRWLTSVDNLKKDLEKLKTKVKADRFKKPEEDKKPEEKPVTKKPEEDKKPEEEEKEVDFERQQVEEPETEEKGKELESNGRERT